MSHKILGICCSLRNARRGLGNKHTVDEIMNLKSQEDLFSYIEQEAKIHLDNFINSGRDDNKPFDEIYKELRKLKGNRGLSNSEIALVCGLWAAKELGSEIDFLSLSEYFLESNRTRNLDELNKKILSADGFLISTPVYFGDRSSLAQSLFDHIRENQPLNEHIQNKTYAGISVGAKRNGGQETTLIYQLLDMVETGLLGVGNDSETTSQYGGTCLAGDIGTIPKDTYGIDTALGTGRRLAKVTSTLKKAENFSLTTKPKLLFWILQDSDDVAKTTIAKLLSHYPNSIQSDILDIHKKQIYRCLACDICPTFIASDDNYNCIITSKQDDLETLHKKFMDYDAIIPVAYSPVKRTNVISNYQQFMERTRYIRRGDYKFSNLLTSPLVIEDIDSNENLTLRMLTSMIRHHTILSKPFSLKRYNSEILNFDSIIKQFDTFINQAKNCAIAKLMPVSDSEQLNRYNPVGYILSAQKELEDQKLDTRKEMIDLRRQKQALKVDSCLLKTSESDSSILIESVDIQEKSIPLSAPYTLSFESLSKFKTIQTTMSFSNGKTTTCETVPLYGYSSENYESVLATIKKLSDTIIGAPIHTVRNKLSELVQNNSFSVSPLLSNIDLLNFNFAAKNELEAIHYVTPLSAESNQVEIRPNITYKIKLSGNSETDINYLKKIPEASTNKFRLDANQAYTLETIAPLIEYLNTSPIKAAIEYIEQPLKKELWEEHKMLLSQSEIPLMLDESITTEEDVVKAHQYNIPFIKLKLFKQGGIKEVLKLSQLASSLGIHVVLGNGVATTLSNNIENTLYLKYPQLFYGASEANGFLKIQETKPISHV